jgi:hypothetical protein
MSDPIIDVHVHFGAPLDSQTGCFWPEEFTKTPTFYAIEWGILYHAAQKASYLYSQRHEFRQYRGIKPLFFLSVLELRSINSKKGG